MPPPPQLRDHEHPPRDDTPTAGARDYSGPVMLADGIALGLLLTGSVLGAVCVLATFGSSSEDDSIADSIACPIAIISIAGAATTFLLVPPIIHLVHARPAAALLSFTLRAALPAGGAALSLATDESSLVAVAFLAGIAAAIAVDWAVLTRPGERDELQWSLVPRRDGAALTLLQRF